MLCRLLKYLKRWNLYFLLFFSSAAATMKKFFPPKSYFFHILAYCEFCLKEQSHSKIFNPYYYKLQNVPPIKTWFALLLDDNIVKRYLFRIFSRREERNLNFIHNFFFCIGSRYLNFLVETRIKKRILRGFLLPT